MADSGAALVCKTHAPERQWIRQLIIQARIGDFIPSLWINRANCFLCCRVESRTAAPLHFYFKDLTSDDVAASHEPSM